MSFWNKDKREVTIEKPGEEKSLRPVLHVMDSLKDYHTELVQKEVDSLRELSKIGSSFRDVLDETEDFHQQLEDFGDHFAGIEQVSGTVRSRWRLILTRWGVLSALCRRR